MASVGSMNVSALSFTICFCCAFLLSAPLNQYMSKLTYYNSHGEYLLEDNSHFVGFSDGGLTTVDKAQVVPKGFGNLRHPVTWSLIA